MPRPLNEYSLRQWRLLHPLSERYEHARYRLRSAALLRRKALAGDVPAVLRAIAGRRVLVTVAFNEPEMIDWQLRLAKLFLSDTVHLIADNTGDAGRTAAVEEAARRGGALYLRLPEAPWRGLETGRNHGLAMDWLWRHVLRPACPAMFGFIDHDLYPLRPTDPFAPLKDYPVAGRVKGLPHRWYLWAGFCFFRFDAVCDVGLDFGLDWAAGLDTGGGNWWRLYRRLDPGRVAQPDYRLEAIIPGVAAEESGIECLGDWLHETHHRNRNWDLQKEKHRRVGQILAPLLSRC